MKSEEFEAILKHRLENIQNVLSVKAREYVQGDDRLHNFRVSARRKNVSMEKACDGMMEKHAVAIDDMINNPDMITDYLINEKIGDMINYLILLEAIMRERIS